MRTFNKLQDGSIQEVSLNGTPIQGITIFNHSPAHLYIGRNSDASSYIYVVEPYTIQTLPLMAQGRIWLKDSEYIAAPSTNDKIGVILYDTPQPQARSRISKNLIYTIARRVGSGISVGIKPLSLSSSINVNAAEYFIPSNPRRRTMYITCEEGLITSAVLQTAVDGVTYKYTIPIDPAGQAFVNHDLTDTALLPESSLQVSTSAGTWSAVVKVDWS